MLTLIQPSLRRRHSGLLSTIFQTRAGFYVGTQDPYDTSRTIYIAYQKESLGVFASARLNLLTDSLASTFYEKNFSKDKVNSSVEVSLISFTMADHWAKEFTSIFDVAIKNFYQDLFQLVADFCEAQGFRNVMSLSFEDDHPDLLANGHWSFSATHRFLKDYSSYVVGELLLPSQLHYSPFKGAA